MHFSHPVIGKIFSRVLLAPLLLFTPQFTIWAAEAERNLAPQQAAAYATAQPPRSGNPQPFTASTPTERQAGQIFRDCTSCADIVLVPAG